MLQFLYFQLAGKIEHRLYFLLSSKLYEICTMVTSQMNKNVGALCLELAEQWDF